jgi:hypothetical protein
MVRHPAAFAGSLKRLNWQFDFGEWLDQEFLMRDLLGPFADRIREFAREERDILDQAILMWNVINSVARHYRETNPDWLFVRYEDLAETPVDGFHGLYRQLGLTWSERVRRLIAEHTRAGNVGEVPPADVGPIRRDSRAAKWTWWTRLTEQEIERVRTGVADVAGWFYSDADWEAAEDRG